MGKRLGRGRLARRRAARGARRARRRGRRECVHRRPRRRALLRVSPARADRRASSRGETRAALPGVNAPSRSLGGLSRGSPSAARGPSATPLRRRATRRARRPSRTITFESVADVPTLSRVSFPGVHAPPAPRRRPAPSSRPAPPGKRPVRPRRHGNESSISATSIPPSPRASVIHLVATRATIRASRADRGAARRQKPNAPRRRACEPSPRSASRRPGDGTGTSGPGTSSSPTETSSRRMKTDSARGETRTKTRSDASGSPPSSFASPRAPARRVTSFSFEKRRRATP